MSDDDKLKALFRQQREGDAQRAPAFRPNARVRTRLRWPVVTSIASTLAAAAAVVLWVNAPREENAPTVASRPPSDGHSIDVLASSPPIENAPLDFLLEIPGQTMLTRAPTFDFRLPLEDRSR